MTSSLLPHIVRHMAMAKVESVEDGNLEATELNRGYAETGIEEEELGSLESRDNFNKKVASEFPVNLDIETLAGLVLAQRFGLRRVLAAMGRILDDHDYQGHEYADDRKIMAMVKEMFEKNGGRRELGFARNCRRDITSSKV